VNKIFKAKSSHFLLVGVILAIAVSACSQTKTTSDAPNSTNNNGELSATENGKATQDDAQSEIRKKQLEADNRAREQRNTIVGDTQKRTEGDLASEVRNKLESNIPDGKLTIAAKNADVTVSGVVAKQEQLDKIKPLAMEIKGVSSVIVKAVVAP
jgi:hyperosmotically inducible periplasmic protein